LSRNPQFTSAIQGQQQATSSKDFDYGGIEGLMAAQRAHKTIANFTAEQQARMVEDYQRQTQEAIKKGDPTALARVTAAYHPFVGQLAKIPPKGANMTQMTQQDLTPAAPPVPPATVAGMPMLPDKLIGGATAPPKAASSPSQASTNFVTQSFRGKSIPGLISVGNIDITKRPNIPNPQTGGNSSVWSTSFGTDKGEVLVPRITNGEDGKPPHILSDQRGPNGQPAEAFQYYQKYGKNLGIFKDAASATAYAKQLHEDQQKYGSTPKTVQQLKQEAAQRNPSATGHKIGEKMRFPNGNMGVWDGFGWEAQ
jgi:hypothetical protein